MRVSFDSNVWETVFSPDEVAGAPIRAALQEGRVVGFICETGFRIEAIPKCGRPLYFEQPHTRVTIGIQPSGKGGSFSFGMRVAPDDATHPGLPTIQAQKLRHAFASGIKMMDGNAWLGLPRPAEILDGDHFILQGTEASRERRDRQLQVTSAIHDHGVGKAVFDAAGGWSDRSRSPAEKKRLVRACAEWADAELVAAHIAYRNDVLCTNDRARTSGRSIFDTTNRAWLMTRYGVSFMTLDELIAWVSV